MKKAILMQPDNVMVFAGAGFSYSQPGPLNLHWLHGVLPFSLALFIFIP
jgi:hypothetical protein